MKRAMIVGGSGAIGKATADLFLQDGYRVALTGRSQESLDRAAADLGSAEVVTHSFDASDLGAAQAGVGRVVDSLGGLEVVVNSAGVFRDPLPVDKLTESEMLSTFSANFFAAANIMIAVAPYMKAGGGSIVNIAATDAFAANPGFAAEGASKAALVAFSQHAAADFARFGIRVNIIAPGWVETPMSAEALDDAGLRGEALALPLVGRIGSAHEVAEAIRFLAGDRAGYVNGATLVVDGGHLSVMSEVHTR